MLVLEKDVETYLKKRVEGLGGRCFKLPAMYETGIPDRLMVLPGGRYAFVELKRPKGGRLSKIQEYQHAKLKALGCRVYVTKNYKEIDAMLEEVLEDEKERC